MSNGYNSPNGEFIYIACNYCYYRGGKKPRGRSKIPYNNNNIIDRKQTRTMPPFIQTYHGPNDRKCDRIGLSEYVIIMYCSRIRCTCMVLDGCMCVRMDVMRVMMHVAPLNVTACMCMVWMHVHVSLWKNTNTNTNTSTNTSARKDTHTHTNTVYIRRRLPEEDKQR
jgi:hypothetical protein